jgi:hypothetical protein
VATPAIVALIGHVAVGTSSYAGERMKGQQKPKKLAKKPAQKSLKERRAEKRAAVKQARFGDS